MKKILLFIIIGLSTLACSDNNDCCVIIDVNFNIKYLNTEGQNLFDIENGYNVSDITIYHKVNGAWKEYYQSNLDTPKGIRLIEGENGNYLSISPSTTLNEDNYSETKIQFSESDIDIIKTEISKNKSNTIVTKIWYNDVLKWDSYNSVRMFEIIK